MTTQRSLNNLVLSMAATVSVFLLTASYAPSTQAAVIEAYKTSTATPVVLAWVTRHRARVYDRRHYNVNNCRWVNGYHRCL